MRGSSRGKVYVIALTAMALVALVTAVAGTAKTRAPKPNVTANLQQLYAAAKKEGTVTWQVATTPSNYAPLVNAFKAKYPGISVNLIDVSGPTLAGRVITEAQAGKLSFDVGIGRPDTISPLIDRKLIAAPRWTLYGVPKSKYSLGGRLIHTYDFVVAPVYNTNMYKASDLPKTWQGLLAPKWANGKFIVDGQPTEGWESLLLGTKPMSLHNFANFVVGIYKQKPLVLPAGANVLNGIATGQAGLGLAPISAVPVLVKKGAPLAVAPITPVLAIPSGLYVLRGAQHPAAAKLLAAFLGQASSATFWAQGGWSGAADATPGTFGALLAAAGITSAQIAYIDTTAELKRVLIGRAVNQKDLHL